MPEDINAMRIHGDNHDIGIFERFRPIHRRDHCGRILTSVDGLLDGFVREIEFFSVNVQLLLSTKRAFVGTRRALSVLKISLITYFAATIMLPQKG